MKRTALTRKQPLRRKPAKPRKKPKPKKRTLRNKADRLFSLYIRQRDGGRCCKCGSQERVQCAHILSRVYGLVRHDPANALALCAGCHWFFHSRPLEWDQFIEDRIGLIAFQDLKRRALRVDVKPDVEAAIENLEELLAADA